jgi:hypothetical protein
MVFLNNVPARRVTNKLLQRGAHNKGENMKKLIAFITVLLFGVLIPTGTIAALYDDFQQPAIDSNKWSPWEFVRKIQDEKFLSETTAYGSRVTNNLTIKNPGSINYIEADVTVKEIAGDLGATGIDNFANPNARLSGFFYNDGSASGPGSYKGEVQGLIRIRPYNGQLWVYYYVWKSANDEGTIWTTLAWGSFPSPVSLNTPYKLSVQFDQTSKTFTFKVGADAMTWTSTDTIHTPNIPFKAIGTDVYFTGLEAQLYGKISATFDNVIAKDGSGSQVLNEDFSSAMINPNNWETFEITRKISEGKLSSEVKSVNLDSTNRMYFKNPAQINNFQAKVAVQGFLNPLGALVQARLGGTFYNDTGNPGSGYQGDVWASMGIGGSGTTPDESAWYVVRFNDVEGNTFTVLGSGAFPILINQTYDIFLGWNGSTFTFKCNENVANYTPTTSKYPANNESRQLNTRIMPPDSGLDFEAWISATFDDVRINETVTLSPIYLLLLE